MIVVKVWSIFKAPLMFYPLSARAFLCNYVAKAGAFSEA